MSSEEQHFSHAPGLLKLWAGWLVAAMAWALHGQTSYLLVPWVCATGWHFTLHLVTLATLALASIGCYIAWRNWKQTGAERPAGEGVVISLSRFMALGGLLFSGLFLLVIAAQGIPNFILSACL